MLGIEEDSIITVDINQNDPDGDPIIYVDKGDGQGPVEFDLSENFGDRSSFEWTSGGNDSFSVNLSLDPNFSFRNYSTYYDGGIIIRQTSWTMPENLWNLAPKGKPIYWKIRGVRSADRRECSAPRTARARSAMRNRPR